MSSRDSRSSGSDQVPFLEEWKAKRERMRLKSSSSSCTGATELCSSDVHHPKESKSPVSPKPPHAPVQAVTPHQVLNPVHGGMKLAKSHRTGPLFGETESVENESPALHGKEKRGSGQRKTRTQIEKRKLREKRRPTGVVDFSLESFEDGDEVPTQDSVYAPRREATKPSTPRREATEPSTPRSEATEPSTPRREATESSNFSFRKVENQDTARVPYSRQKSVSAGSMHVLLSTKLSGNQLKYASLQDKEPSGGNRKDLNAAHLERKMNELQQAVTGENMENQKLVQQLQEKEGSIEKLKLQMCSLREDMDGAEDENQRLREEHQTLLKVVGQLSG